MKNHQTWLWRKLENNAMQKNFVELHHNELQWQQQKIDNYMRQIVKFREKLLILMHFIDDQSTRTFEILNVRHCNIIRRKHRNIFVENELIVFVIRNHKEYNMKRNVKMIHRYLSQKMRKLLMYYLLLILSFQQRLKLTIWKKKNISTFL